MGSPTGSPGNLTWVTQPGRYGSGMAVGGGAAEFTGYGYGAIGPNGPDRNNLPMPWPSEGLWWAGQGTWGDWPPALTRCSSIITGGVMGTPWSLSENNNPKPLQLPQWLINPMGVNRVRGVGNEPVYGIVERRTAGEFFSTIIWHALNFGRGAWTYEVAADGFTPIAGTCLLIDPFAIERHRDSDVWVFNPGGADPIITDRDGYYTMKGNQYRLIVMRGLPPHDSLSSDWFGGVIPRHFASVTELKKVHGYISSMYDSPVPSGVLKVSTPAGFTSEEADRLKSSWVDAHGNGKSGGVAVLNSTVDYQQIAKGKLLDMDIPSVTKASLMSIAHAYGLSSVWLDVSGDSITYTNRIDARTDLVDQTLRPMGNRFEQMIDSILPAGQRLSIKWAKFIQASQLELAQGWLPIWQAGAITLEEFRSKFDMPPNLGDAVDEDDRR